VEKSGVIKMAKRINYNDITKNSAIMTYIEGELNSRNENILKNDRTLEFYTYAFSASVAAIIFYLFWGIK
jgi:hypothetical protein